MDILRVIKFLRGKLKKGIKKMVGCAAVEINGNYDEIRATTTWAVAHHIL
jgi:hypothetical protein